MAFHGLSIGLSSLLAQRRAIEVTGHNLANVATPGYSRQRVELHSDAGPITPALHSVYRGTGSGVQSGSITRMRDQFLELRGYQEHAELAHARQLQSTLSRIEAAFGEPSDTGLGAQLADFWAGWDDVANRPDDIAARAQLLERASTLASSFARMDSTLTTLAASTTEQLEAVVAEVNAAATRIADLNATIQSAVNSGLNANDLMDQRDVLVSRLAERVGVTVRPAESGTLDVYVGGTALVRGTTAEALRVDRLAQDRVQVSWVKDGLAAVVSGSTGAMQDTVNGAVPGAREQLGQIVRSLHDETNRVHGPPQDPLDPPHAFDLDGNPAVGFFHLDADGRLWVNPTVAADPRRVAAAGEAGTLDGSKARELASSTATDAAYRELVVRVGVHTQSMNTRVEIQAAITQQVDAAREAESGVNLDEEMTNLIAYQHAYDAAARFVRAVDEMLATLVNLGR